LGSFLNFGGAPGSPRERISKTARENALEILKGSRLPADGFVWSSDCLGIEARRASASRHPNAIRSEAGRWDPGDAAAPSPSGSGSLAAEVF